MIYMFLSNNPSSGDINSSNLPCSCLYLQVNLDSKTRLETVTNLDNPTRDMYKSAQKRIQYLMEKDPYPRFLESEVYLQIARQCSRCDSG